MSLFLASAGGLSADELGVMAPVLAAQVKVFFPCDRVDFFHFSDPGRDGIDGDVAAAISEVERRRVPFFDKLGGRLFLPIWHEEEMIAVAVIAGGDAFLVSRGDEIRLLAATRQMSAALHALRDDLRDPQTGLFNGAFYRRYLMALSPEADFTLGLVELAGGSHRDLLQILAQLKRSGATLDNYFKGRTPLCHLGSGVFAFFLPLMDDDKARKSARFMVSWLRREGMVRACLGLVCAGAGAEPHDVAKTAWETMKKARLRGSFAWAVAGRESAGDLFSPPPPPVMQRLRAMWRGPERFALVLFRVEGAAMGSPDLVFTLGAFSPREGCLVSVNRDEVYLFLADVDDPEVVREQAGLIQARLFEVEGLNVSAAAALYPCLDYNRGAIPVNCRKALLHAAFFLPRGLAVFDSVSLNISGDRYYAEGDLGFAVREYRCGLKLNPDSVKLLNSLGVALVEMGRRAGAREMFERAAVIAPDDFMAGYNLALLDISGGRREAAVTALRRCLEIEPENSEAMLQLASLLIAAGEFSQTVDLLAGGEHPLFGRGSGSERPEVRENLVRGVLYRYLAQAYKGQGLWREATRAVEKAVACNPASARAAALMGEIYLSAGEGLGAAMAVSRKAVVLDSASPEAWRALGRVLVAAGEDGEAETGLRQARRLAPADPEVCLLLAEVLERRGKAKDAEAMRLRAARLVDSPA